MLGQIFERIWTIKAYIQKVGYFIQVNVPHVELIPKFSFKNYAKSLNNFQLLWKFHPFSTFIHVRKITMWYSIFFTSSNILDMIKYIPKIFYLHDNRYSKKMPLGSHVYYSHSCAHELINILIFTTLWSNKHLFWKCSLLEHCFIVPKM